AAHLQESATYDLELMDQTNSDAETQSPAYILEIDHEADEYTSHALSYNHTKVETEIKAWKLFLSSAESKLNIVVQSLSKISLESPFSVHDPLILDKL